MHRGHSCGTRPWAGCWTHVSRVQSPHPLPVRPGEHAGQAQPGLQLHAKEVGSQEPLAPSATELTFIKGAGTGVQHEHSFQGLALRGRMGVLGEPA